MKIAILGTDGYIGSALAMLWAAQHEILAVGRHQDRLARLGAADVALCDVANADRVLEAVADADAVIHAASLGEPRSAIASQIVTTRALGEWAQARGRRFVYLSTAHVYGSALTGAGAMATARPWRESDRLAPATWYAHVKANAEFAAGPSATILRLVHVYGRVPGGLRPHPGGVVDRMVSAALLGEPIAIDPPTHRPWSFLHLRDLARAIEFLLLATPSMAAGVYNVAGDDGMPLRDLAKAVSGVVVDDVSGRPPVAIAESGLMSWDALWVDASKLEARVGWRPTVTIEDGLRETVEAMRA